MKPYVSCNIEAVSFSGETAWAISLPSEEVLDAILLVSGLLYGKVSRIKFADKSRIAMLFSVDEGHILNLDGTQITISKVWLEAVLGMLLEVCLKGWSDTAHLDQDFENVCVTVAVLPPK